MRAFRILVGGIAFTLTAIASTVSYWQFHWSHNGDWLGWGVLAVAAALIGGWAFKEER